MAVVDDEEGFAVRCPYLKEQFDPYTDAARGSYCVADPARAARALTLQERSTYCETSEYAMCPVYRRRELADEARA